jgi:hypothetical protein
LKRRIGLYIKLTFTASHEQLTFDFAAKFIQPYFKAQLVRLLPPKPIGWGFETGAEKAIFLGNLELALRIETDVKGLPYQPVGINAYKKCRNQ